MFHSKIFATRSKILLSSWRGDGGGRRDRDRVAQFAQPVEHALGAGQESPFVEPLRIGRAVAHAVMEHLPDHTQLVVRYRPDRFLRTQARTPGVKAALRLAAFTGDGRPGNLRKRAAQHPVAFSRARAHRHPRTLLLTGTDPDPRGEFAGRLEYRRARSGFGEDVLRGSHMDARNFAESGDGFLMSGEGPR